MLGGRLLSEGAETEGAWLSPGLWRGGGGGMKISVDEGIEPYLLVLK